MLANPSKVCGTIPPVEVILHSNLNVCDAPDLIALQLLHQHLPEDPASPAILLEDKQIFAKSKRTTSHLRALDVCSLKSFDVRF
jgi:hypothetical protein